MVSLCVSSGCISPENCHNLDQVTHTAYQIAKAACTYNVGELVVLESGEEDDSKSALTLAALLQYFVTPPYLVQSVLGGAIDTKLLVAAKKLPKITTLPFMTSPKETKRYREGMTILKKPKKEKTSSGKVKKTKAPTTKYVNIGGAELFELASEIPVNARVTVDLKEKKIVSPFDAYGQSGVGNSFGYQVRVAKDIKQLFSESGLPTGYSGAYYAPSGEYYKGTATKIARKYKHLPEEDKNDNLLVVVAPWKAVEQAFERSGLKDEGVGSSAEVFDGSLKTPAGSRVEDGALIALAVL